MLLDALKVLHFSKRTGVGIESVPGLPGAFHINTCQRQLWIYSSAGEAPVDDAGLDSHSGSDAYRFLLRVSTGLESEIQGETDVFGQIKECWKRFELEASASQLAELRPWIQKLFEDTKDIRARFLQHSGGGSYGSLVRKLIDSAKQPTLLVGAGQLGHSIAPWLLEGELWILNRNLASANELRFEVLSKAPTARIRVIESGGDEETMAWRSAAQAVVCIPAGAPGDAARIQAWSEGGAERSLVHLGGLRRNCDDWAKLKGFHCLDDLFELQKTHGESRSRRFERALKACDERSLLRAMGGSISIPHGWEDLAVFA